MEYYLREDGTRVAIPPECVSEGREAVAAFIAGHWQPSTPPATADVTPASPHEGEE